MSAPLRDVYRVSTGFAPDAWRDLAAGEPVPAEGHVILTLARWQAEREALRQSNVPIGIRIEPGEKVEEIAEDVSRFSLIALAFPAFTDGRNYSSARLLRERYGYEGELRAVGNVLLDQIPFMLRCGFDTFNISHGPTRRALEAGHVPEVPIYMQPIAERGETKPGARPWLRRRG